MYDPIAIFWLILWTSLGSYGMYLLLTESKTASSFYVYGKSLDTNKKKGLFWTLFLVPKRYFIHFYLTSATVFIISLAIVTIYYVPSNINLKLKQLLDLLRRLMSPYLKVEIAQTLTSVTALIFTLILMTIQSMRRLYESLLISVYSSRSKINILHYIFGHVFYMTAALSTTCPILLSESSKEFTFITIVDNLVTKQRALVFVLFVYASHHQHKCHKILANLRKDKTGQVITEQHYVPSGGLFEYISCPHFLFEVIIYFLIILAQSFEISYWNLIFLLVISTQTINALTEHKWYKKHYKDYPKQRKAIFPKLL